MMCDSVIVQTLFLRWMLYNQVNLAAFLFVFCSKLKFKVSVPRIISPIMSDVNRTLMSGIYNVECNFSFVAHSGSPQTEKFVGQLFSLWPTNCILMILHLFFGLKYY